MPTSFSVTEGTPPGLPRFPFTTFRALAHRNDMPCREILSSKHQILNKSQYLNSKLSLVAFSYQPLADRFFIFAF